MILFLQHHAVFVGGCLIGVVLLVLFAAAVSAFMIRRYTTYTAFDITPSDFGLTYIPFTVQGARAARVHGWYIPANQARAVLIASHGVADSKNGMLPYLLRFHQHGLSIVVYDLRHHGESTGRDCTLGYFETRDLLAVTRHVREQLAPPGAPVVYWGFSLGATISLLAAARQPQVRAVIAQSPFISLRAVVRYYAWRFFLLPPPVAMLGVRFFELITGARAADVDLQRAVAGLASTPVLIIGSPQDRQVPYAWLERAHALLPSSQLIVGPYGHDDGMTMDAGDDEDVVHGVAFIKAALATTGAAPKE